MTPLRFKKNPLKGATLTCFADGVVHTSAELEASRAKMLREQSGAEMILFVTPIIKSGAQIIAFAFETVISASPIINSVLEIIISAPDTIDFGFHMIDCELDTIISGLHMVIVKPSITNCVLVAVFLRTEISIDKTEISIDAIVAVLSKASYIPSFQ